MSSPFDGMSGIISRTLGGVVLIYPGGAAVAQETLGVFRESPVEVGDAFGEGGFWTSSPSLRLSVIDAEGLGDRDRVDAGGKTWRVTGRVPGGSPAIDAFVIFELEVLEL